MDIIGIDPGVTTGYVVTDEKGSVLLHGTTKSPLDVIRLIDSRPLLDHVVMEDFIGGGIRDKYVKRTLMVLGVLWYYCKLRCIPITLQAPQVRRPYLRKAGDLLMGVGARSLRHKQDAMAHVLAYLTFDKLKRKPGKK